MPNCGGQLWNWLQPVVDRPKYNFCDAIDRLNCSLMPVLLLFFVVVLSANMLGYTQAEAMRCLKSPEMNPDELDYAVGICQTKNGRFLL
jgi:hypothetical protein